MCCLGWLKQTGKWVDSDPAGAVELYRQAAQMGATRGMVQLGDCLMDGIGVAAAPDLAVEWYKKAAKEGNGRLCSPWD